MNILIENALVLPMTQEGDRPRLMRGTVGIEGDRIVLVDETGTAAAAFAERCGADLRRIDARGKLLMPGLINTHSHVPMTLMRGLADDIPLMPWLQEHIWPYEAKLDRDDIALATQVGVAEMLLGGTTTFVDMYWSEEAVGEVVERTGIRAVLAPTFTDMRWRDFVRDFHAVTDRYAKGQVPRITLMVAPHAPYSCSEEHLRRGLEMAGEYGLGIYVHVAETQDEVRLIGERAGLSPVAYLDRLGMLTPRTIAVHAVWVDDDDIALLLRNGVSVAHNPQSNMKISSGIAPVSRMMAAGINVGIGTDGPCSNNDLDMWDEMRTAALLQKVAVGDPCVMPAYEVLKMATVNGARAIGREGELGVVREGALADLILIDMEKPHYYPRNDLIASLVYCGKAADVDTVIVAGQVVVEHRYCVTLDVDRACRRLQERALEIERR